MRIFFFWLIVYVSLSMAMVCLLTWLLRMPFEAADLLMYAGISLVLGICCAATVVENLPPGHEGISDPLQEEEK